MSIRPGQLLRLIHINFILIKHGLDEVILATHLFRPLRVFGYLMPWRWIPRQRRPRSQRIRMTLEDLGPIFVKFGQILSTRRDLLPQDIAQELSYLQDRVPSFPGEVARSIIEHAYNQPLDAVFDEFEAEPLASASIAQVHAARLKDGREVVVKVVRPGIERVISRDLQLLYTIGALAQRYWPQGYRLRPVEVIHEFDKTIHDELDLMREAANASQLRRNFKDSSLIYVPDIYWPGTRTNVMVMERIRGIPISDIDQLKANGINLKALAERGVEIFFTQVFRDSFFHADMHPGNVFIDPNHTEEPMYLAVDFGIIGTLNPVDHRYLAENFLAFFNRNYRRVAELHIESGWVPAGTRVDEFEAAIRTVCEPIFQRPLGEISFGSLLLRLFQTGRRFNMEIQPQLILLQKTLLNIEGMGRQLYPELDLWTTAKPYMERWMREQLGIQALLRNIRHELPSWGRELPTLPGRLAQAMEQIADGRRQIDGLEREIHAMRLVLKTSNRRTFAAILGAALVVSAFLTIALDGYTPTMAAGAPLLSWILGGLGTAIWLVAWRGS
ncbi:MAG: ubiquinone biosynthesis regulatory protein kinase UbiB [Nitrococcus mobilis]|nr:ubiquinone biosynthesis regulatory protein kinase UbiB [Nitrococcus mobilis]